MAFIPTTSLSSLAINKCVASTLRITTALRIPMPFTIHGPPPPSLFLCRSPCSRSPSPKRPWRSESRDSSMPPPRAKPRAPKHSKLADFIRLSGLFIGTVEYQVKGSFVVLMWVLLLRCATTQVTGVVG